MTEENQAVSDQKVVSFHYTLKNDSGEVLESSQGGDPMAYLHGQGQLVPGLEREMSGKTAGDAFNAEIAPSEGYGEKSGPGPQPVDRSAFPDGVELHEGMAFPAELPDGNQVTLWITEVDGDNIMVDGNHPLAGETLYFDVEIVEVRDASAEEISHGHAHGPGGHQH